MTNDEAKRIQDEQDHGAMMRNPDLWPWWPLLPLKHSTQRDSRTPLFPRHAVLAHCLHNEYRLVEDANVMLVKVSDFQGKPAVTVDDVLAAGWLVD